MPVGRSPRRRRLLAAGLGLLGALLLAEGVSRIDALFPGMAYDAVSMRGFLESRAAASNYGDLSSYAVATPNGDPREFRPVPDPWSGWTSPALVHLVERGTRWFRTGEHARSFDVVLLGGSFAAQFGNLNDQRLRTWLADVPEVAARPVHIWNLSVAAQKQPSHLNRLTGVLALGWKPDLVVCIDGYNELAISAENAAIGVDPVQPSATFWGTMARAGDLDAGTLDRLVEMRAAQARVAARARTGLALGVWRSALFSRAWSAWLAGPQAHYRDARERYEVGITAQEDLIAVRGPAPVERNGADALPGGATPGVVEGVAAWADAARNLRAICDARGLPLVHAIQPGLDDADSKPVSDEETRTNVLTARWRESVRTGYPLLRANRDALQREHVQVQDGSRLFADRRETLYIDGCHLNDRGYELYGLEVVAWIRRALAKR